MDYINIIISFILGGGLTTILTLKYTKAGSKIDMTEKAIKFWEEQFNSILEKHQDLELKYEELKKLIEDRAPLLCYNLQCKDRHIKKQTQ